MEIALTTAETLLFSFCRQIAKLELQMSQDCRNNERKFEQIAERLDSLYERVAVTPAMTAAGLAAKAHCVMLWPQRRYDVHEHTRIEQQCLVRAA